MPSTAALEVWGFVTGAACVALLVRQSIWNWPFGIASNVVYYLVFVRTQLYADAGLQLVFLAVSVFGWWNWARQGGGGALRVARTSAAEGIVVALAAVATTLLVHRLLDRSTDSDVPLWDAATSAASLAALYLMTRKRVENWPIWIVVNVAYIGLYLYKHLAATAVLYAVYLVLAIAGWRAWRSALAPRAAAVEAT